ncbi:sensor histidine kinase [Brevibacillus ginsengisoli]|uniref:sensor histidine kinase n=1 Tax=Brevibacillus ginsengisoli TaxID=363854 RepID=UPI003CF8316B
MDTKLKNKYLPVLSVILAVYLFGVTVLAAVDFTTHKEYLDTNYYFKSYAFENQLETSFLIVESYYKKYNDYDHLTLVDKVGRKQFTSLQQQFETARQAKEFEIQTEFNQKIQAATNNHDTKLVALLQSQKEKNLADAKQEMENNFEQTIQKIVSVKDQKYGDIKDSLIRRDGSFKYFITDNQSKQVFSNMPNEPDQAYLQNNALYSVKLPLRNSDDFFWGTVSDHFEKNNWEGYLIIPKEVSGYSQVHVDYQYYLSIRERLIKEFGLGLVTLLSGILLLIYARKQGWIDQPVVTYCSTVIKRIPIDIRAGLFLFVSLLLLFFTLVVTFFYTSFDLAQVIILSFTSLLLAYLLLNLKEVLPLFRSKEAFINEWNRSFISTFIRLVKESFLVKSILFKVATVLALTGLYGVFIGGLFLHPNSGELMILTFGYSLFYFVLVVPYILKRIGSMNKILQGTEEIASGNLNYVIAQEVTGNLSSLADNINNMKQGFKKSLESQMKSERLKSELITNVSHDLKTPLTSIINYVNLLKRDELTSEDTKKYVEVLDRKTQRLQILIDDLFEASKMASGAVELDIENVDLAALLTQALAEYDDKINSSTLTFRVKTESPKIFARLDGKKTWRVLENLISNALKYSLPHSRVYITITEQVDKVILSVLNTSAYELDFDEEEIFERFKRGDQSRHTEGSGLGLAIAKSIMELQGGDLRIEVEGDHFKAIAEFQK